MGRISTETWVSAMEALDALNGYGEIPAVLHNEKGHVTANLRWRVASGETSDRSGL